MKSFMDEKFKGFLNNVMTADHIEGESVPEWLQEGMEHAESGEENLPQDELCLDDLVCEFKPKYLKDHLPVFADAAQIIQMEKTFKERPELRNAERTDERETGCDGCKTDSGRSGSKEQEEKDK